MEIIPTFSSIEQFEPQQQQQVAIDRNSTRIERIEHTIYLVTLAVRDYCVVAPQKTVLIKSNCVGSH